MNIGQAAKASGVSAKMVRYYESIGLVPAADRKASGYRDYGPADVHRLGFIRRARDLGFSVERIRDLLALWSDRKRSNARVKAIALEHVAELTERARHLEEMAEALKHLAVACDGDGRPDCPIIKGLEGTVPLGLHCGPDHPATRSSSPLGEARPGRRSRRETPGRGDAGQRHPLFAAAGNPPEATSRGEKRRPRS